MDMVWRRQVHGNVVHGWETADLDMPQLRQPFRIWLKGFVAKKPGKAALAALEPLKKHHPHRFRALKFQVLFSCWCAAQYRDAGGSPLEVREKGWTVRPAA